MASAKGRSWNDYLLIGFVGACVIAGTVAIALLVFLLTDGEGDSARVVSQPPTSTVPPTKSSEELAAATEIAKTATAEHWEHRRETAIARPPPTPRERLSLISSSCSYGTTFVTCEGFVKNITTQPIEDVQAVINWYDADGVPRSSDDALIDYDPILAGQTSPWSVIGRHNPALTRFRVEFKEFFGGTILTRDDRP